MNKKAKIQAALDVLPLCTPGDWWCANHELLNDPIGSVKIAKYVSGANPRQADAHRQLLASSRELAEEVLRLRLVRVKLAECMKSLLANIADDDDGDGTNSQGILLFEISCAKMALKEEGL